MPLQWDSLPGSPLPPLYSPALPGNRRAFTWDWLTFLRRPFPMGIPHPSGYPSPGLSTSCTQKPGLSRQSQCKPALLFVDSLYSAWSSQRPHCLLSREPHSCTCVFSHSQASLSIMSARVTHRTSVPLSLLPNLMLIIFFTIKMLYSNHLSTSLSLKTQNRKVGLYALTAEF